MEPKVGRGSRRLRSMTLGWRQRGEVFCGPQTQGKEGLCRGVELVDNSECGGRVGRP